ncbi:LOW QUALITY PROTEIN: metacaspase-6-like [Diospyros lotus]|uniref:LOW QUALITY PROTEIN: metacaspase-6-like n=1 Tax=Diospyros lotus TaxID=55363 RepID=UPI00224D8E4A|nr:LOW QUALITY PROTEIN: metacaspase-6-like [Diospyros lotus]
MGRKKAVLIGCNYPGTDKQLMGCVNDVWQMYNCLVHRYGFYDGDIQVLIDTDDDFQQPTGRNIRRAITNMIRSAKFGDVLFLHFSGHGIRLPSESKYYNTGYDECIVPTDLNLITDDDFKQLVNEVPKGCRITIVADSCHSGGLIANAKEQIGESTKKQEYSVQGHHHHQYPNQGTSSSGHHHHQYSDQGTSSSKHHISQFSRQGTSSSGHHHHQYSDQGTSSSKHHISQFSGQGSSNSRRHHRQDSSLGHHHSQHSHQGTFGSTHHHRQHLVNRESQVGFQHQGTLKNKYLPLSNLIEILKRKTGKDDICVGNLRLTLFDIFGEDVSPKIKLVVNALNMAGNLAQGLGYNQVGEVLNGIGNLAQNFLKLNLEDSSNQVTYAIETTNPTPTRRGILISACQSDQTAADDSRSGQPHEAFGALSNVIQIIIDETKAEVTNRTLVLKARQMLKKQGFTQRPGLYCSDHDADAPFLC